MMKPKLLPSIDGTHCVSRSPGHRLADSVSTDFTVDEINQYIPDYSSTLLSLLSALSSRNASCSGLPHCNTWYGVFLGHTQAKNYWRIYWPGQEAQYYIYWQYVTTASTYLCQCPAPVSSCQVRVLNVCLTSHVFSLKKSQFLGEIHSSSRPSIALHFFHVILNRPHLRQLICKSSTDHLQIIHRACALDDLALPRQIDPLFSILHDL